MSKQPLRQEDVDSVFLAEQFLSLEKSDIGNFRARRIFQMAEEYYNKYPNNINIAYVLAHSFFAINRKDEGIEFFRKKILPFANKNLPNKYIEIHRKYAALLYFNKEYKKALDIVTELEKIPEKKTNTSFLAFSIPIYFENNLYQNMLKNIELFTSTTPSEALLASIYLLFYYYYTGNYNLLMKKVSSIASAIGLKALDNDNINIFFEEIKKDIVVKIEKPEPTDLEKEFLDNIRKRILMHISFKPEEISFNQKIKFNDKKYTMHVERCEEGGFYGEITGIDGCFTQGETLKELKANILEVLELYSEEELTTA